VVHQHLVVPEGHALFWRVELIDVGQRTHLQPEHGALVDGPFIQEQILAVQVDWDAKGSLGRRNARHVIHMGMSKKDVAHGEGLSFGERQETLHFVARIDQHRFPRAFAANDEAILEKWSYCLCLNYHGRTHMILAIVDDLMFTSKIKTAATKLGVPLAFARSSEGALAQMRTERPALVIFDLNSTRTAPLSTASAMKSDPSLADIPSIGFVSHVQTELIDAARQAGIEEVLARSAFTMRLPEILARGK
jgi:PleD family two-component response regulator